MKPKVIRNEAEYNAALQRIEALMENDPEPTSSEGEELDLLAVLVERYEEEKYPIDLPSPVDAIQFAMDQAHLKPKDLIPYIGSASKVSEVLSGRRELSKTMIRNLVTGLDIPAEVLLQESKPKLNSPETLAEYRRFPIAEMVKRGWFAGFSGTLAEAKNQLDDLFAAFAGSLGNTALMPALNRQHVRSHGRSDEYALAAWRIRVVNLALRESLPPYRTGTVKPDFLADLARLSDFKDGPKLAREFLNKHGIHLVIERHLPRTYLDGAAIRLPDGSPLVALTLRYDRLDNFWFTLFHELAHVALHLDRDEVEAFFDDLADAGGDRTENAADAYAAKTLIPPEWWKAAQLTRKTPPETIKSFAGSLRLSPAIVAGRIRHETRDYTLFKQLIGAGKVRALFESPPNH